jgi:hypothetical protein
MRNIFLPLPEIEPRFFGCPETFFLYVVEALVSIMLFTEMTFHCEGPIKLMKLYWPNADTYISRSTKIRNFGALRD